ncbi:uroporphyrinogen-III synthase [Rummeliibacillus sp. JY-2-4R]
MPKLAGKQVALLAARKIEEQSTIVKNLGGTPVSRPSQGTVFLNDENVKEQVLNIIEGNFDWMILTTGVGTETLIKIADEMGKKELLLKALKEMNIAARGYKTVNTLKKYQITPIARDDDGSTVGLIRALKHFDFQNIRVALQLHGDPAPKLVEWLKEQQAQFNEILPYQHIPPETTILEQLLEEILNEKVDAVSFTSTPQVRNLFAYAEEKGKKDELLTTFETNVVALSVGKVTGQALKNQGVQRIVIPEDERMGSALMKLAQYYDQLENQLEMKK